MTDATPSEVLQPGSPVQRFSARVVRLPRLARIILAVLFAVAVTLLLTPMIDDVYIRYFFDFNTRVLPSLVSTGIGVVMYVVGWVLMIGYSGETPPPRKATFWYFLLGCVALAVVAVLLITGALDMAR